MSKQNGEIKNQFFQDETVVINYQIDYNVKKDQHDYSIFCIVLDQLKNRIFSAESKVIDSEEIQLHIESNFLVRGNYSLYTFIHKSRTEQIDAVEDVCSFNIIDNGSYLNIHGSYDYGKVFGKTVWKY